jgi:ADP-ribose pyrophosphatase YjhB (NUDIX family)
MSDRVPFSFRVIEAVDGLLRRHTSEATLRLAYRVGYFLLRPWWFVTRPHTRGVKAIVRHGDEVLLVRHTYTRQDRWDLPGGFLRPDEDPEHALRRELAEEVGAHPTRATLITRAPYTSDHKRETLYAFAVDVDDQTVTPSPAEIREARWFPRDALPPDASRMARRLVARAYWELWEDAEERP